MANTAIENVLPSLMSSASRGFGAQRSMRARTTSGGTAPEARLEVHTFSYAEWPIPFPLRLESQYRKGSLGGSIRLVREASGLVHAPTVARAPLTGVAAQFHLPSLICTFP